MTAAPPSSTGVSGNALTFTYTVAAGETSADLQVTKFNANSAVISDTAGTPPT